MLWGATIGGLEVRQTDGGGAQLRGLFPYAQETELSPGRSEMFASRAFEGQTGDDVLLLSQHDMDRPLASVAAGTLTLRHSDDALRFEAEIQGVTSWQRDALAAFEAGLVRGLSPGFRVRDGGARIERRGSGTLRTITKAELVELSVVTRAAYPSAQIEARNWRPDLTSKKGGVLAALRWR